MSHIAKMMAKMIAATKYTTRKALSSTLSDFFMGLLAVAPVVMRTASTAQPRLSRCPRYADQHQGRQNKNDFLEHPASVRPFQPLWKHNCRQGDLRMRADAFRHNLRAEGGADTLPPALTTARGNAQWLTAA